MRSFPLMLLLAGLSGAALSMAGELLSLPYWLIIGSCIGSGCVLAYVHVKEKFK